MFAQQLFGSLVLLVYHCMNLVVDGLCCLFAVRTVERVFIVVIIAQVRQFVAHACVCNHSVCLFCHTLKVVHCACGYMSDENLLGSTSAEYCTHLVKHLLLCGYLTLFGHVPCSTECPATRNNGNFNQRVGMFKEPRYGSMSGFVYGNGLFLLLSHNLCLFLQSTHYAVNSIKEVLFIYSFLLVARGDKGCLVAYIGNICARESRCLACQSVNLHRLVELQRFQMHLEHLFALIQVGQIHMYLTVETSCT